MRARQASFLISASAPSGFPPPAAPEIAFAGRSNVGKSSLINTLTGVRGLARTSSTPGRTRLLNWFRVVSPLGEELAFVDLPGYGYAKVSRSMRAGFGELVDEYITKRPVLRLVIVILDARRGVEHEEHDLMPWLEEHGRSVQVVMTKSDKLPKAKRIPAAAKLKKDLGLQRMPIVFSASEPFGIEDLWRRVSPRPQKPVAAEEE